MLASGIKSHQAAIYDQLLTEFIIMIALSLFVGRATKCALYPFTSKESNYFLVDSFFRFTVFKERGRIFPTICMLHIFHELKLVLSLIILPNRNIINSNIINVIPFEDIYQ